MNLGRGRHWPARVAVVGLHLAVFALLWQHRPPPQHEARERRLVTLRLLPLPDRQAPPQAAPACRRPLRALPPREAPAPLPVPDTATAEPAPAAPFAHPPFRRVLFGGTEAWAFSKPFRMELAASGLDVRLRPIGGAHDA